MSTIYVVLLTYIRPIEEVDAHIEAHVRWLKKNYDEGYFLASGRRVPRIGGVILSKGESLDAVRNLMETDPFYQLGLTRVEIVPFQPSMTSNGLETLL
ncbi:YciI family protein [Bartonella sp. LJL80]